MAWHENKFLKLLVIFPQLCRQVGEQTSQLRSWATFHAQLHNITSPFCLGPSALHTGTRARLYFFYCFNGWFSEFLSSGIEMLGLPLCSSCNTSLKVIYLAKLTISFKISLQPAIIAGYSSCFCREVDSDSLCSALPIHSWIKFWWISNSWLSTADLTTASPLISPSVVMGKIVWYLG